MLSIKKLFITSLLFSKIILSENPEQQVTTTEEQVLILKEQSLALEQQLLTIGKQITNFELEYINILNLNIKKEETLKKLSILNFKAEKYW